MSTSRAALAARPLLERATNPAIVPIPQRTAGNNVPHSLHKTRRWWKPNSKRFNLPVNVLGGAIDETLILAESSAAGAAQKDRFPQLAKVKMNTRDMKSVMKSGGIEGLLLSRPPSQLTPFGRQLRSQLFAELHRLRDELNSGLPEVEAGVEAPAIEGQ